MNVGITLENTDLTQGLSELHWSQSPRREKVDKFSFIAIIVNKALLWLFLSKHTNYVKQQVPSFKFTKQ